MASFSPISRPRWASAASGSFPYEVGTNGDSAFVLFYLAGFALIVLPLMLAELALGRRGRSDAIRSILKVASAAAASPRWGFVGAIGVVAGFLILSFYSVIGGWAIAYLVDTVRIGLPAGDAQAAQARFDACAPLRSSWRSITLSSWRSRRRSSPAASPAASRRRQKS